MRDTENERQRHRQREKQAPCREPNRGLNPGTPGLHPGPKAGTKLLHHPGICKFTYFKERESETVSQHKHAGMHTCSGDERGRERVSSRLPTGLDPTTLSS